MMLFTLCSLVFAQAGPPAPSAPASTVAQDVQLIPGLPPGPPPPPSEVDERARVLGRSLRCPVCQGSNITDSPSETAKAMFERTRQLIAAGYTEQQIKDYFVDKYDTFILLEPQANARNAMLYLGPGLGVGLGIALALKAMVGWRKEPGASPVESPAPEITEELDDYERRLLAELNRE